jgi:ligand-binding sensor protein
LAALNAARCIQRNKHLGGLASAVKENLGDGIRALTLAAEEARKGGTGATPKPETSPEPKAYECTQCHAQFAMPQGVKADQVGCPKCGAVYTKEQLEGQVA